MQFSSVEHALSWAFQIEATAIVKTSSVHKAMMGGGGKSHGDLSPHDRHAYAAMIIDQAERAADRQGMTLLRALYGVPDPKDIHAYLVPMIVAGLPTGIHSRRAVQDIINAYCGRGKGRGVAELRRVLVCGMATAMETRRTAYSRLDAVYHRAISDIEMALYGTVLDAA